MTRLPGHAYTTRSPFVMIRRWPGPSQRSIAVKIVDWDILERKNGKEEEEKKRKRRERNVDYLATHAGGWRLLWTCGDGDGMREEHEGKSTRNQRGKEKASQEEEKEKNEKEKQNTNFTSNLV